MGTTDKKYFLSESQKHLPELRLSEKDFVPNRKTRYEFHKFLKFNQQQQQPNG